MMKKAISLLFVCCQLIGFSVVGQNHNAEFAGKYSDGFKFWRNDSLLEHEAFTRLVLKEDGDFSLTTTDLFSSNKYQKYTSEGKWIADGENVILNPGKTTREREFDYVEKPTEDKDSITVKINYQIKNYDNEAPAGTFLFKPVRLTVFFNKRKKYVNLVTRKSSGGCGFAPRIRQQTVADSIDNSFKISRRDLQKIGIMTYGFDEIKWFKVADPQSGYFEITITQPLDTDRRPRNRKIIMRKNKAHFYLVDNEISYWSEPLKKQSSNTYYLPDLK